ncbi:MAG: DUF134 domain-containing protein [Candidatus Marinimicrobia bacterium]|nr:DUF134 domain-containing protein [Candidatus Neomarinimicrobiota bacterium]
MPRPRKKRCCRQYLADRVFKPQGIALKDLETTILSLDQFEAIRLCDIDNLSQIEAGEKMGVSRGTIQRLLYETRKQIAEAILHNNAIIINLKESEDCHVNMHSYQRKRRTQRHSK